MPRGAMPELGTSRPSNVGDYDSPIFVTVLIVAISISVAAERPDFRVSTYENVDIRSGVDVKDSLVMNFDSGCRARPAG